jgi:DNA-binding FadR family transcriptional regulator
LRNVVNDFYDYALDFRRQVMQSRGAIARSVADHRAIVAALQARDPAQAAAAMHHHRERVRKTTMREMAN